MKTSVIVIIKSLGSQMPDPKVITISGFHFIMKMNYVYYKKLLDLNFLIFSKIVIKNITVLIRLLFSSKTFPLFTKKS